MKDCLTTLATIIQKAIMKELTNEQTIAIRIRFSLKLVWSKRYLPQSCIFGKKNQWSTYISKLYFPTTDNHFGNTSELVAKRFSKITIANIPVRLTKWKLVFMETAIVKI